MMLPVLRSAAVWLLGGWLAGLTASAATRYVWQESPSPGSPYTNWATAAHTIQDAVDAAAPGDQIAVTNGTYASGGRAVHGTMINRLAVDKPLAVRSVNGPDFTVIQGAKAAGGGNGDGAIRCVYLTNGTSLSGFTLRNGATRDNKGNMSEQSGGGARCESDRAVLSNCVVTGCSANNKGGGVLLGTLNNCELSGNSAYYGGGASICTLNNCTLTGNSATWSGGGVGFGTLNNCTLTGNSAVHAGGGAEYAKLSNCIVYFNAAPTGANYTDLCGLDYCCTTPLPPNGVGNIPVEPLFQHPAVGNLRLQSNSPCIDAGLNASAPSDTDLDGNPRIVNGIVDVGAYEFQSRGSPAVPYISLEPTNQTVTVGGAVTFIVRAGGTPPLSYQWSFQGATLHGATNSLLTLTNVAFQEAGDYFLTVTNVAGAAMSRIARLTVNPPPVSGVHYVDLNSPSPSWPFTNWATAARTIHEAMEAAVNGDEIVVSNGVYATGGRAVVGRMTNRVAVTMPLRLRSVNGPQFTVIQGYQVPGATNGDAAIRCVYLCDGASLSGFTLSNGATRVEGDDLHDRGGGGVWCESVGAVVSNCVLAGNSARGGGGGAASGTLNNCTLDHNSAGEGGGACQTTLNNCTLTANSAFWGGGVARGVLNSCTLEGNSARGAGGGAYCSTLTGCSLSTNFVDAYGLYQGGGGAYECTLSYSTLTGNSARAPGGGAFASLLDRCTLRGNSSTSYGGGVAGCTVNNCLLIGNSAAYGGGASYGPAEFSPIAVALYNSTLVGNSAAGRGGGVYGASLWDESALNNCIVYFNTAPVGVNYHYSTPNYCCTAPQLASGIGNITNAPLFVDDTGGDLRLQSNSPCINAGLNAYAPGPTDLGRNPRIVRGTVDIGAYEYQEARSLISYAWLQQFGLPTDGSADFTDPDGDRLNNWQEWRCDTVPTNALSVLRILSATPDGPQLIVSWQSLAGVSYFLERSTNLAATPRFTPLATNLPGQPGTTTFTDTNTFGPPLRFYRVGVPVP